MDPLKRGSRTSNSGKKKPAPVSTAKGGPHAHETGVQNGAWPGGQCASHPILAPNLTPKTGSENDPVLGVCGPIFGSKMCQNRCPIILVDFKFGNLGFSTFGRCKIMTAAC